MYGANRPRVSPAIARRAARELEGAQRPLGRRARPRRHCRARRELQEVVERAPDDPFPQDPVEQLPADAIEAVFASWNGPRAIAYRVRERIPNDLGTAVNVQAMVFGNRTTSPGTGVGFTRDPATGERALRRLPRERPGRRRGGRHPQHRASRRAGRRVPPIYEELLEIFARLETHFRDMCDTEFTIEQGKLWMLQTRVGKRTGSAALRMAVEMVNDPVIALTREEAVNRVSEEHVDSVLHPQFAGDAVTVWTKGLGASPAPQSAASASPPSSGRAAASGDGVILVRNETSPEDVARHARRPGHADRARRSRQPRRRRRTRMGQARRRRGRGAASSPGDKSFSVGDVGVREGDVISIDGIAGTVVLGAVRLTPGRATTRAGRCSSAGRTRSATGRLGVRANADNGPDAANAGELGAEGIGLCRTEHMFLGEDRLPIVRRMILAATTRRRTPPSRSSGSPSGPTSSRSSRQWTACRSSSACSTRRCMSSFPTSSSSRVKKADRRPDRRGGEALDAAKTWREANPMLGIRGVRLGVLKPGLYAMQVRALMEAAVDRVGAGGKPIVEIMIPLTVSRGAGACQVLGRRGLEDAATAEAEGAESRAAIEVAIGTMIETPRARSSPDEIAEEADFFSFGTNDLTQMTFGFSRDDVEGRMMAVYLKRACSNANPFENVDTAGVGELVRIGVERGRGPAPASRSVSAASTAATRPRSTSSRGRASTTSAARRTECRSRRLAAAHSPLRRRPVAEGERTRRG